MAKAFQVDLNRCTGCQACVLACAIENELPISAGWRTVYTFNEQHHPELPVYHLPLACNHCDDPACLRGCPTRAYTADAVTGAVVLDPNRCMGCTYCTWMCPYNAPQFDKSQGVVQKCTFCNHRLHEGLEPACVACCPTTALRLGERNGRAGVSDTPGFTDSPIGPAISLVPLRSAARIPQLAPERRDGATALLPAESRPNRMPKISWRSEWTLLVFTFLAPILIAWFAAAWLGRLPLHPQAFVSLGIAAITVSTLHLGRRSRAHLAMANWRQSWLSREILCFTAFVGLSSLYAVSSLFDSVPRINTLGWIVAAIGVGAVVCIDMVYMAAATVDRHRWHSASALLTALFYVGMFSHSGAIVLLAGSTKAALYVARKRRRWMDGREDRRNVSALRLGIGLVAPLALWFTEASGAGIVVLACCLVGELIDRCEFYDELQIVAPAGQILRDQRMELQRRKKCQDEF